MTMRLILYVRFRGEKSSAKDVHESKALFHILDDGDGTVTLEERSAGVNVDLRGTCRYRPLF